MSLRGSITLECDIPTCHGELVIGDLDIDATSTRSGIDLSAYALYWEMRGDRLICPQCVEDAITEKARA